jgi:glucosylceramidase
VVAGVLVVTGGLMASAPPAVGLGTVHNWQTSAAGDRLTAKSDLTFVASSTAPTIEIDPTRQYQAIDGFGGAFNEAGWAALTTSAVSAAQRSDVMEALFDPVDGAGFTLARVPMGSNDFALTHYSYSDLPSGTDFPLSGFSVTHDEQYLIPYIQAAQAEGDFRIMASPWTAPAWMKTNNSLVGGGSVIPPSTDARYYQAYALYFAKYVQAYASYGITIDDVSIQNEPQNPALFESTLFTAQQMADFVADDLGPTFEAQDVGARIRIYEHNQDTWTYPVDVLADSGVLPYVAGVNYHPYECDFGQQYCSVANLDLFAQAAPGYSTWQSEHTDLDVPDPTDYAGDARWAELIVDAMTHGESGYLYWNMVLDEEGGPVSDLSDSQEPLVVVDSSDATATISYMPKYYHLAHFSKFVRPGAHRIGASGGTNADGLEYVAFKNPDGSEALVVVNTTSSARSVTVGEQGYAFTQTVAANSTNTFTWSGDVTTYHVVAGSADTWNAVNADHYMPDAYFSGGTAPANTTPAIADTADDPLYQSERYGSSFSYAFPVPDGRYRVGLRFSENYWTSSGQRVFDVSAEGTVRLDDLDIYAAAGGRYVALDRTFDVDVTDGALTLAFASSVDNAKVGAISVTPIPEVGTQHDSTLTAGVPSGFSTGSGTLPGLVFAQDYNDGGEGHGYHFSTTGGTATDYRTDATHLESCSNDTYCGQDVGWLADGDYLNFTTTVNASGNYDVKVRVATPNTGGQFAIDLDGRTWIGTQNVPVTGAYQTWQTVTIPGVNLTLGTHTLTFRVVTGGFNFHYLDVAKVTVLGTPPVVVEAEHFAGGGEGVGSHDITAGNSFTTPYVGYLRGGDTDLEISSTGTFDVGNTENGEWLRYDVYGPTAASYTITLKVASAYSSGQVRFDLNTIGNTIGSTLGIPSTGGWQTWSTVNRTVSLPQGTSALYVYVVSGGFNLDSLTFS